MRLRKPEHAILVMCDECYEEEYLKSDKFTTPIHTYILVTCRKCQDKGDKMEYGKFDKPAKPKTTELIRNMLERQPYTLAKLSSDTGICKNGIRYHLKKMNNKIVSKQISDQVYFGFKKQYRKDGTL